MQNLWFYIFGSRADTCSVDASLAIWTVHNCTVINTVSPVAYFICFCTWFSAATSLSQTNSSPALGSICASHNLALVFTLAIDEGFPTSAWSTSSSLALFIFCTLYIDAFIHALAINKLFPGLASFFNAFSSFAFLVNFANQIFTLINTLVSNNLFPRFAP